VDKIDPEEGEVHSGTGATNIGDVEEKGPRSSHRDDLSA
jgi:hypothetical protein